MDLQFLEGFNPVSLSWETGTAALKRKKALPRLGMSCSTHGRQAASPYSWINKDNCRSFLYTHGTAATWEHGVGVRRGTELLTWSEGELVGYLTISGVIPGSCTFWAGF